jgi:hypothetical protein
MLIEQNKITSNQIRNFNTYDQIKSSSLAVSVYYDDISYLSIEEYPQETIAALVGNIGGFFGLFMGASILSFFEILDLVARLAIAALKSKTKVADASNN